MPLPPGTWKVVVNGVEGILDMGQPDVQGNLSGKVFNIPFDGFWDEPAQRITLTVGTGGILPVAASLVFNGYLFITPPNPAVGQDVTATLTGTLQVGPTNPGATFPAATARRNVFGWFAQITQIQ